MLLGDNSPIVKTSVPISAAPDSWCRGGPRLPAETPLKLLQEVIPAFISLQRSRRVWDAKESPCRFGVGSWGGRGAEKQAGGQQELRGRKSVSFIKNKNKNLLWRKFCVPKQVLRSPTRLCSLFREGGRRVPILSTPGKSELTISLWLLNKPNSTHDSLMDQENQSLCSQHQNPNMLPLWFCLILVIFLVLLFPQLAVGNDQ